MKRVFVIGAGAAGLTAAYELLKRGKGDYRVTVLEESDCVGGLAKTVVHNGNRMDIGGHRFFSKDARVLEWWEELFPTQGAPSKDDKKCARDVKLKNNGPDPEKQDEVMLSRRRVSRIYYNRHFFDYPIKMDAATFKNMGMGTTIKAGFSYLKASAKKLPETSLENFYINRFGRRLYSMFFESYTEKLWGRHPKDISPEWGAQRVKGLSIRAIIKNMLSKAVPEKMRGTHVETSLIEEFLYPKYGPGQMWEAAAEKIKEMGGEVLLSSKATGIEIQNGTVSAIEYINGGKKIKEQADMIISSMPLRDLIDGINSAPENIKTIAEGLPYRDFVTVGLLVDKLGIKNETKLKTVNGIVPDCWIYVQDAGVKLGRVQIFNNWSPYLVKDNENTVWIGLEYFCDENDVYWNMTDEKWRDMASGELEKIGIISKETRVSDAHVERVKKAYPAYFDTYSQIDALRGYLDGIKNLYCIGRNGQHRYNNMDHSMATAFETVDNILSGRRDNSNIWNVNTEETYSEE